MGVERDDCTKGMRVLICNHPKTRKKGDSLCLFLQKAKLIREQKLKMCFGWEPNGRGGPGGFRGELQKLFHLSL